jgi:predicted RNA-binding protein YlqC (UPF0109 family)
MQEFIEYLVKNISTKPEEVVITLSQEEGLDVYKITAATEDMGTIIGKEGHTIKSLRDLVRAKAIKDNVRVRLVVEDTKPQTL